MLVATIWDPICFAFTDNNYINNTGDRMAWSVGQACVSINVSDKEVEHRMAATMDGHEKRQARFLVDSGVNIYLCHVPMDDH